MLPLTACSKYKSVDDLAIVTSYFNPCNYKTILKNYLDFVSVMASSNMPVYTVECAFDDKKFELKNLDNVTHVRSYSVLWQKERLLNIAIKKLPEKVQKIAWVDADVFFTNPDWAVQTSEALETYSLVQPFSRSVRLPQGSDYHNAITPDSEQSFCSVYSKNHNAAVSGDYLKHGHTGFAWACRREILGGKGLYDAFIIGNGDHVMAHAACGDWKSACLTNLFRDNQKHFNHFVEWAEQFFLATNANIGCVRGTLLHKWHGNQRNRRYLERSVELSNLGFNPNRDLRISPQGCYEWNYGADKSLRDLCEQYFFARKDDANPEEADQSKYDWISNKACLWTRVLDDFRGKPNVLALEVGSFEGRSAVWFSEHILTHSTSKFICIDPFVRPSFSDSVSPFGTKIIHIKERSQSALRSSRFKEETVDFAYVDGSHEPADVLEDCVLVFRLLKRGGILIMDDYLLEDCGIQKTKTGIDAFLSCYHGRYDLLFMGWQIVLRRL